MRPKSCDLRVEQLVARDRWRLWRGCCQESLLWFSQAQVWAFDKQVWFYTLFFVSSTLRSSTYQHNQWIERVCVYAAVVMFNLRVAVNREMVAVDLTQTQRQMMVDRSMVVYANIDVVTWSSTLYMTMEAVYWSMFICVKRIVWVSRVEHHPQEEKLDETCSSRTEVLINPLLFNNI